MGETYIECPPPLNHNAFSQTSQVAAAWEALKIVFPGIILAPLRLLLIALSLLLATLASLLARYVAC
jgi:hypothetical protein